MASQIPELISSLRARLGGRSNSGYEYSALEDGGDDRRRTRSPGAGMWSHQMLRLIKLSMTAGILFVVVALTVAVSSRLSRCDNVECTEISQLWGQYSPAFSVHSDMASGIPAGCEITFAQVLSRHGSRDPTASKTFAYADTLSRIQAAVGRSQYGKGYRFIRDFEYILGADELTVFGQNELRESGRHAFRRYGALIARKGKGGLGPFVRASGQSRVIMSANNWTQGFLDEMDHSRRGGHGRDHGKDGGAKRPRQSDILIIPEEAGINNTLSHGLCDAFEDGDFSHLGAEAQLEWLAIFAPPIAERVNKNLPGAGLSEPEVIYLMDLCPFVTVASPEGKLSPFCALFTPDEWRSYDYYQSLGKYYGFANGNPLGPTQGVGFVNELIARLTGKPVDDHTSVNSTLDQSPDTFPLDRQLYADFSHDNDMMTVYAALGLYNSSESVLPRTRRVDPTDAAGFSAAWTVPFAARMYVEKMSCPSTGREEWVRVLINDRVVPVPQCSDALGRCRLSAFVGSLAFARDGGSWGSCSKRD